VDPGDGQHRAVSVIPYVGNLSDKIGRKPPIIIGALGAGLMSFGYLYAISIHHVPLAIVMSLLMWGIVYQGYNAVYPSFYPELFPTRTRVSGMAISQNLGTAVSALLPVLFVTAAPPGAANIPLTIGSITLAICIGRGAGLLECARDLSRAPERPRQARRAAGAEAGVRQAEGADAGASEGGLGPSPRQARRPERARHPASTHASVVRVDPGLRRDDIYGRCACDAIRAGAFDAPYASYPPTRCTSSKKNRSAKLSV
jgi:MFS family permease